MSGTERETDGTLLERLTARITLWPLALRVAAATLALSLVAILSVGWYLSSAIATGLVDQRRARIIEQTELARETLSRDMRSLAGASLTQRQDNAAQFMQSLMSEEHSPLTAAALLPVTGGDEIGTVYTDPVIIAQVTPELRAELAENPDAIAYQSVSFTAGDASVPGMLTAVRITVPGEGSYDLVILFSLQQEQQTLTFMRTVLIVAGTALVSMMLGVAAITARMVHRPLAHVAEAAEQIAGGDLSARVSVQGSDELATVSTSFNAMAESMQDKIHDLTRMSLVQQRFVSNVSHELRTPLTTIKMASSLLSAEQGRLDPTMQRTTQLLSDQVNRFDLLLADLLEISRHDAGGAQLDAREADLRDVVQSTVDLLRPLAEESGSRLLVSQTASPLLVSIDEARVARIVRNLLVNAIEHAGGSVVVVESAGNDQAVAVVVQDFGTGISPEQAAQVFERFWRADPARARTLGGTGLGLAISLEDARLHGGLLEAWGELGRGAVFRLTLPRGERPITPRDSPLRLRRSLTPPLMGGEA